MRRIAAVAVCALAIGGGAAFAGNPAGMGQPNQNCEDLGATTPAPFADENSAFTLVAGTHYADGQLSNPTAASQYDVACYQTMTHARA